MLAQERYDFITLELKKHGSVTVADISAQLDVSIETVRRDLIMLETHGKLKRVFGGAVSVDSVNHLKPLTERLDSNVDLKYELARYAVSFIDNNDTVAITTGSTAAYLAKALLETDLNLTVITHSNSVFEILKSRFNVILIGGEYLPADDCFCGALSADFLKSFHANKCFIFPSAITVDGGSQTFIPSTIEMERTMAGISDKVFIAADSDKFDKRATFKALDHDEEYIYITDSNIKTEIKQQFCDAGYILLSKDTEEGVK